MRGFLFSILMLIVFLTLEITIVLGQSYQFHHFSPSVSDPALKKVKSVAVNSIGEVFMTDAGSKSILVYDTTGKQINVISSVITNSGTVAFGNPGLLYIDQSDNLYVYDESLAKVIVKPTKGTGYAFGSKGTLLGQFDKVSGLVADSHGYVYVLNGSRKQVDIFQPGGAYLTWIAGAYNLPFNDPISIGINGADELYVLEKEGATLYMYDITGKLVNTNRNLNARPGAKLKSPINMTVFKNGHFLLLDGESGVVTQFDRLGNVQGTIGSKGSSSKGVFVNASYLSAGTARERALIILDEGVNLAQAYTVSPNTVALVPSALRMKLLEEPGTSLSAEDMALAPNGYRYEISQTDRTNVIAYDDATNKEVFALIGTFGEAVAIATDSLANLFVVDRKNKEVSMFDNRGILIRKFGKDIPEKLKEPTSVCLQSSGNIIVADHGNGCLHMWNSKGIYLKLIASKENSTLQSPWKIQVDSKDQIYIWDDKLNAILRTGISGWPTAANVLKVRGEKPGGKEGDISGFFVDPLDQVVVFNKTTSQLEAYAWELDAQLKFSIGRPGTGTNGFDGVDNILFNKETFRVHFLQHKTNSQLSYQFVVQPPTPESALLFEVAEGKLQVRYNKLNLRSVKEYGLRTIDQNGDDSLAFVSSTSTILLPDQKPTDINLHQYNFVSVLKGNCSASATSFYDYLSLANLLIKVGNYDEALANYLLAVERMGRSKSMVEYISHKLCSTGIGLAQNADLGKALKYHEAAFLLSPKDKETCNSYEIVLALLFQQFANTGNIGGIVKEAAHLMENRSIESIVLNAIDTVSITLGKIEDERSITGAITLQKKLLEWAPGNASYCGSLAATTFELYKFKNNKSSGGLEPELILQDAGKYALRASDGLKQDEKPYREADLLYLQILNEEGKFEECEKHASAELAESSATIDKQSNLRYRKELARAYGGQGKYELAEQEYRSLLIIDSEDKELKELLAHILIDKSKYDEAQQIYQQLLVKERDNVHYIAQIGIIEMLKGNYAEASFQLEKAIKLDPSDKTFYGPLAEAFDGSSNYKKALENYGIAIQYLQDKNSNSLVRKKTGWQGEQNQKRLLRYLTRVGELNEQTSNPKDAILAFNKIIEADVNNAKAYYGLGKASLSAGLVYDAVNAFYSAIKLEPSNSEYSNAHTNALNQRDQLVKNEDPLNILDIYVDEVFPSLYKNYSDARLLPLGKIVVANNTSFPITPTSVTVFVKELMLEPTEIKSPALVGYANSFVLLTALFNENILNFTDDQKFQLEVEIKYTRNKEQKSIKKTTTFVLHGRNAISWADKRRLAAFISPDVDELINYSQQCDQIFKSASRNDINSSFQKAIQIYTLLNNSNFLYSPDPSQSFATVTSNTGILDKLQYPTETLKRKSGDCDDLVGLYAGLLENAGIATAYIDIPGHVFMAFDCEIKPEEISIVGLNQLDVIIAYGSVWIPIETTLIGTQNFILAWKNAAQRYNKELAVEHLPEIIPLADARAVYIPSVFVPEGFSEVPPTGKKIMDEYTLVSEEFTKRSNEVKMREMESRYLVEGGNVYVKNKYAMLLAKSGDTERAHRIFMEALELSPENPAILNNLGNMYYMDENTSKAVEYYEKASAADPSDAEILINLCKAHLLAYDKAKAKEYFDKALSLDIELGYIYDYLNTSVK